MPEADSLTPDALFAGRLQLVQPRGGHRVGTDAMLLAAAAGQSRRVADFGAGAGAVGLGLVALGRAEQAMLVEREPELADLARRNILLNGLQERVSVVEADVTARASALEEAGLAPAAVDLVVCNPPFNTPGRHRPSPDPAKRAAHALDPAGLAPWIKAAARALEPGGRFVLIHRPEALDWLLPLIAARFGAVTLRPVHARAEEPAGRMLLSARLNSKAPTQIAPALSLHEREGGFSAIGAAIHEGRADLS